MATGLGEHTNQIQDGTNRRGVYEAFRHEPPRTFTVKMEDVTQAQSIYAIIPWTGTIEKIYAIGDAIGTSGGTPHQHVRFSFGAGGPSNRVHFGTTAGGIEVGTGALTNIRGHETNSSMPVCIPSSACKNVNAGEIMSFSSNGIAGGSHGAMDVTFTVVMQID